MKDLSANRKFQALPFAVVLCLAAVYLAFVYGYPRVFLQIEAAHPENYEANIEGALEEGRPAKALKIARQASHVLAQDPGASVAYGRLLAEAGRPGEAETQFLKAVAIRQTPGPDYRKTGRPFYHAPARLELGARALEEGQFVDALTHFELARPYADLESVEFASFHSGLFTAYTQTSQWSRALAFVNPLSAELAALDESSRLGLAYACEAKQDWRLMAALCDGKKGGLWRYFLGRQRLATGDPAEARSFFEGADPPGHGGLFFYLGLACEQLGDVDAAVKAYGKTPSSSSFRPFALARAGTRGQAPGPGSELASYFNASLPFDFSKRRKTTCPFQLLGASEPVAGISPLLLFWEDHQSAKDSEKEGYVFAMDEDGSLSLAQGQRILQLQWAPNILPFATFDGLPLDTDTPPGWRKVSHIWDSQATQSRSRVVDGAGPHLEIVNADPAANAAFISNRMRVEAGKHYLVAVRAKCDAPVRLTWLAIDAREWEVLRGTRQAEAQPQWQWLYDYVQAPIFWDTMTVQIGLYKTQGTALLDDLSLFEIREPKRQTTENATQDVLTHAP